MIVTDSFVFLALPRTGTTFVRDAIKELYRRSGPGVLGRLGLSSRPGRGRLEELILPMTHTWSAERAARKSPHGGYRQVPIDARDRPLVSVMRDPFDLLVSHYEHRFWQQHPIWDVTELQRCYPGYPDLRFEQYVEMMHHHGVRDLLKGRSLRADVGNLTLRFLKMFCRDPDRTIDSLDERSIERGLFRDDLAPVRFLHTEKLVSGLREFLAAVGFPQERTRFMLDLPRSNAAEARGERPWQDYYSPELRERVRHAERVLFRLFPDYDR